MRRLAARWQRLPRWRSRPKTSQSGRSAFMSRRKQLTSFVDGSPRRDGPTRKPSPTGRRAGLGGSWAAAAGWRRPAKEESTRPSRVHAPQEAIDDLRRRIAAPRWPEKKPAPARSRGGQLAKMEEIFIYGGTRHDWRKAE